MGRVHVDDISGWVDNTRLLHYLRRWKSRQSQRDAAVPTNQDIYEIMLEADREEESERKPFHIERIANNIRRNGVQEHVIVFGGPNGKTQLWDGNRRYFGTRHIMQSQDFSEADREAVKWLPAYVYTPSGDPDRDQRVKHAILTEMNFVEKDHIPWPSYVKAQEVSDKYVRETANDPGDPAVSRQVKVELAAEYGLKGWRVADRWIKMYHLAQQFKEYHEETHSRDDVTVDLFIQEKFEYFDELSKPAVWGVLERNPDARDKIFDWLWDQKFISFTDVRMIPQVLDDPVAMKIADEPDGDAFRRAMNQVIANDPVRRKSKEAANEKIVQFAEWLDTFKREDYRKVTLEALVKLKAILTDVVKIIDGLQHSTAADGESRAE
jgi:hypothetical protein